MAPLSAFTEQRYPIRVPSFGGDYIFHTTSQQVFEFLEAGNGYCQIPEDWHAAANLPHVPCIRSLGVANLTWYSIAKLFIGFTMFMIITLLICWLCGRMGWCFRQPRATTRHDQGAELRMLGANSSRVRQQEQQHVLAGDQEADGGIATFRLRDWRNRYFHRAGYGLPDTNSNMPHAPSQTHAVSWRRRISVRITAFRRTLQTRPVGRTGNNIERTL
ncbi:hypothetical protein PpBr36_04886 [Pyricularia pennisetigena]|uniref:hypothetical protein n=1 Tax=Pyricularia pennisetigena TaxID=1578925 RepID=UPI00114EBEA7|nr:hypothetical protein PpBr36_04886 [Pyricularia pennisetigena]TLS27060.1 hypothetical protein PpBr36_04886 [Pyricularia pennisetigena]